MINFSFDDNGQYNLFDLLEQENKNPAVNKTIKKPKINKKMLISSIIALSVIIIALSSFIGYRIGYNNGFEDNQPISEDGSIIVYITRTGTKYHNLNCEIINSSNAISISLNKAEIQGYTPCSKCR